MHCKKTQVKTVAEKPYSNRQEKLFVVFDKGTWKNCYDICKISIVRVHYTDYSHIFLTYF